jgi:hypothetical protein
MRLSDPHAQHLASSDIDSAVSAERGTFSAKRGKDVPQGGGWLPKKPGIVFPVHTLDGRIFHRLRPDKPGQMAKYMQPKDHPNRLDVHPRQHERIKQPGGMRYVTEGEKKVDAGVSHGALMVGQSGVFNGQRDKGTALIDDWHYLPLAGEDYAICYDSDIDTNEQVQLAADRLARLLEAEGANVHITLLPPAPDGSKQGLDDFLANGGTLKQLELLTRPYSAAVVERVRLSRDEKLRAAVSGLWRRWWDTQWVGQGGHTDRDLALKGIEAARKHGRIVGDDLVVRKAWGPLMLEAKISSSRTMSKSIKRLEKIGFFERDNAGRQADKAGTFVFRSVVRAGVKQYGEKPTLAGTTMAPDGVEAPGTLHPRAPRLMHSSPKFAPKRGTVAGTRKVRESKPAARRPVVVRLGKMRGALVDAVEVAGGSCTLSDLCRILHRDPKRRRDLVRRKRTPKGRDGLLVWLEDAGILFVEGDTVMLAPNWLQRLEDARKAGGELEAEELARKRYRDRSRAFHDRDSVEPERHHANAGADGHVEDLRPAEELAAPPEPASGHRYVSPLAAAVRDYLDRCPHDARRSPYWIGATLWAHELHEGKPTADETKAAIEELGGAKYLDDTLTRARGVA